MPHIKKNAGGAYERRMLEIQKQRERDRIRSASPAVDSKLPYSDRYRRPIQPPPITARDKEIEYENVLYFQRLDRMKREPSSIDHHAPRKVYEKEFFTAQARALERERVEEENEKIMDRLLNTQTCYPTSRAEEQYAKNRVIAERIRRYEDTDEDEDEGYWNSAIVCRSRVMSFPLYHLSLLVYLNPNRHYYYYYYDWHE